MEKSIQEAVSPFAKNQRPVYVGILGLGTVGSGVVTVLTKNADIIAARATKIQIVKVADRDTAKAEAVLKEAGLNSDILCSDWQDLVTDENIDIMVEVTGGIDMPREAISAALRSGKSVVTANKDLIAAYGGELLTIAFENGVDLFFEASVAGGIPVIQVMKESLAGNHIQRMMGIVNGTTNYILTRMSEDGMDFNEALKEAQALGYAEANPKNDIEGYDAARKVAILASIAFNSRVKDDMVSVEGITGISSWDIKYAEELGYVIKMLGLASEDDGMIDARVHPVMLPKSHPLASVRDSYNAVFVEGDALGKAMFYGRGAGSLPTGSAIVGDIISAARNICAGISPRFSCTCYQEKPMRPLDDTYSKYYVRISVYDRPGVFAAITGVLCEEGVSIDSVIQKRRLSAQEAEIVLITHAVRHASLQRAVDTIAKLDCVVKVESIIRVEEGE